jgi:hypothetical protein
MQCNERVPQDGSVGLVIAMSNDIDFNTSLREGQRVILHSGTPSHIAEDEDGHPAAIHERAAAR